MNNTIRGRTISKNNTDPKYSVVRKDANTSESDKSLSTTRPNESDHDLPIDPRAAALYSPLVRNQQSIVGHTLPVKTRAAHLFDDHDGKNTNNRNTTGSRNGLMESDSQKLSSPNRQAVGNNTNQGRVTLSYYLTSSSKFMDYKNRRNNHNPQNSTTSTMNRKRKLPTAVDDDHQIGPRQVTYTTSLETNRPWSRQAPLQAGSCLVHPKVPRQVGEGRAAVVPGGVSRGRLDKHSNKSRFASSPSSINTESARTTGQLEPLEIVETATTTTTTTLPSESQFLRPKRVSFADEIVTHNKQNLSFARSLDRQIHETDGNRSRLSTNDCTTPVRKTEKTNAHLPAAQQPKQPVDPPRVYSSPVKQSPASADWSIKAEGCSASSPAKSECSCKSESSCADQNEKAILAKLVDSSPAKLLSMALFNDDEDTDDEEQNNLMLSLLVEKSALVDDKESIMDDLCGYGLLMKTKKDLKDLADSPTCANNLCDLAIFQDDAKAQLDIAALYDKAEHFGMAMFWYKKAAKHDSVQAKFRLGQLYEQGKVGHNGCDTSLALHWYNQAAKEGYSLAQARIGFLFEQGLVGEKGPDYQCAALWYEKAAMDGSVFAQTRLGALYYRGQIGKSRPDYDKAASWFRLAAEYDDPLACACLGHMIQEGLDEDGNGPDIAQASYWYELAADQGEASAQMNLGSLFLNGLIGGNGGDELLALFWFRKSAEQGYAPAQEAMGLMYLDGIACPGGRRDFQAAFLWFTKAGRQGHASSQTYLAVLLDEGLVQGRKDDARFWYKRASLQGFAPALTNLGFLHETGRLNGSFDLKKAEAYYRKAAKLGFAAAQANLGCLYQLGQIDDKPDYTAAAQWYKLAAEQGLARAQTNLAYLYDIGLVSSSHGHDVATMWYEKAAQQGCSVAKSNLHRTPTQSSSGKKFCRNEPALSIK